MSADNKPVKGILKPSTSFDKEGHPTRSEKEMKWDEMNILATYHPADKDYGHKKIDEPPTPYNHLSESEGQSGEEDNVLDPQRLASSLSNTCKAKVMTEVESSDDDEDDEDLTEEEKVKKREFVKRRKLHYNEFQAVKLARQLLESEEDEEEADGLDVAVSKESATASTELRAPVEMDTAEQLVAYQNPVDNENL